MKWNEYKTELNKNTEFIKAKDELKLKFALANIVFSKRLELGLSQSELAKKIGTKQSNISKIESGRSNPTLEFIYKISKALNFPVCFENTTRTEYSVVIVRDHEQVDYSSESSITENNRQKLSYFEGNANSHQVVVNC